MKHDFHFVLGNELKINISDFADNRNMSLSEAVVYIFNFMKPVLEKHYLKDAVCKKGGYTLCAAKTDMHVFFDKTDYKYLKQVQSNLYCFSMALVLRWMLDEFFRGVDEFGFDRFCEVVYRFGRFFLRSMTEDDFIFLGKRHMFSRFYGYEYICHIFDNNYNLLSTTFT